MTSTFADNDASWRLMERIGMRREAYLVRDALHRSGQWLDSVGYAILRDEWATRTETPGSVEPAADAEGFTGGPPAP